MFIYVVYIEDTLEIIDVLLSEDTVINIFNCIGKDSGLNWKAININDYFKSIMSISD